jgi:hypothetical protein
MPIILNDKWRITCDKRMQWILQRRAGNKVRVSATGTIREPWDSRYFFDTRAGLISCISEHCGEVSASALEAVGKLPGRYEVRLERANDPDGKELHIEHREEKIGAG